MKLYLIQHGEATPEQVDPLRPLTAQGREDVLQIASFLKDARVRPTLIYHSEKLRAKQTAEIIASAMALNELIRERKGLLPQDVIDDIAQEISRSAKDLMIVGHLPFLSKLATFLLVGKEEGNLIAFQPGGVVCLKRAEDQRWQVAWMVVPEILK
ncbi:MAG: phosphohistidine phosphatase SixA [Thermodesulfobacteriota bacterium]